MSVCFYVTGKVDFMEIKQSLADLGLDISQEEAQKILQRYFAAVINIGSSLCRSHERILFLLLRC